MKVIQFHLTLEGVNLSSKQMEQYSIPHCREAALKSKMLADSKGEGKFQQTNIKCRHFEIFGDAMAFTIAITSKTISRHS